MSWDVLRHGTYLHVTLRYGDGGPRVGGLLLI